MSKPAWNYDRDIGEHVLPTDGGYIKIGKSPGGDYYLSAQMDDDPCGGDVEYHTTLARAKKAGEQYAMDGTWVGLTLEGEST